MKSLEVDHVSKTFGGVAALKDVCIGFAPGTITALVGPNGAGKTTLFNIISGLVPADSGTVRLDGRDLNTFAPWQRAAQGIGRLFQDVRIFGQMTVMENLLVAFPQLLGEHPSQAIWNRKHVNREEKHAREKAEMVLGQLNLDGQENTRAAELSFGQQKLLAFGRLLISDPAILLLDEPTAGISPQLTNRLLVMIRSLAGKQKSVVVIEHNMSAVLKVADFAYFIDSGEVLAFGLPADLLSNDELRAIYMGV